MLIEAVILNGDQRIAQIRILLQFGVRNPQPVFRRVDALVFQLYRRTDSVLPILHGFVIHIIDTGGRIGTRLHQQRGIHCGINIILYVDRKYRSDDNARDQTDQHNGQKNIQHVRQQTRKHLADHRHCPKELPSPRNLARLRSPALVSCHSSHQPFRQGVRRTAVVHSSARQMNTCIVAHFFEYSINFPRDYQNLQFFRLQRRMTASSPRMARSSRNTKSLGSTPYPSARKYLPADAS